MSTQERMASQKELAMIEIGKINSKIDAIKRGLAYHSKQTSDLCDEIQETILKIGLLLEGKEINNKQIN